MPNTPSIRFRLTAWYFAIFVFSCCLVGAFAWVATRTIAKGAVHEELAARREAVKSLMAEKMPQRAPDSLTQELDQLTASRGQILRAIQICDSEGKRIYQSALTPPQIQCRPIVKQPSGAPYPPPYFEVLDFDKGPLGLLTSVLVVGDRPYTVQTVGRLDIFVSRLDSYLLIGLVFAPVVLLLGCLGGYWMSRQALAPVDKITAAARSIGARNLSQRLEVPQTDDELQRLSETLNEMFQRLESAFKEIDSAYRQVDSAYKRVTQFTADASHELRTPVAVMRATAEVVLQKQHSESEYREALGQIHTELERTSHLIEDLMTLTRADAGSQRLVLAPMDLKVSIQQACREGRALAVAKQIGFDAIVPEDGIPVRGDAEAIRRLFLILIDNAVKYTPSGGTVVVSLEAVNGFAVGRVKDSGIGISSQDLPNIFERFYRADKARSRRMGGFGLGLPIARWIADAHSGQIDVQSSPGRGSSFSVKLPILTDEIGFRTA